ncbi:cytochrome P450 [Lizonia empirigonia]|nr:cytochrome P450 [Lizonia empirigonia]
MAHILSATFLLGPLTAITLHETILRRVEVDHLTLPILAISSTVYSTLAYYTGFLHSVAISLVFWFPLWIYIGVYRHWHRVQQGLRKEYGDYVRTGPRELSIFDPEAVHSVLGLQSKTSKGPFYDVMERSLHLNRDILWHRQRRKVWDNAMKTSISDFAPRIEEICDQLLGRLRHADGKPVLLLEMMAYFSYDAMSALAFGKPMGFTTGESSEITDGILNTFTQGLNAMDVMYHMPWLMNALGVLTSLAGPLKDWTDWSVSQMQARMALKDASPDLIGELIKNTSENGEGRALLYRESRLIISAGSETTSTALTFVFMQLATHPHYTHAIRAEQRATVSMYHCSRPLPLLDAVINESMRLWPSVFFASQRVTPPEGLTVNDHFIPGNMIVQVPPFVLDRDARNFVSPDSFVPERWTSRPEMTGRYSCAGKSLAWMELRSVVRRVVNEFDVMLPREFVKDEYWGGVREHFTAGPPKQEVMFIKVSG